MKFQLRRSLMLLALGLFTVSAVKADVTIGKEAPDFSLPGSDGKTYNLKDYRGKYVVLEWYNRDCPFIQKHYAPGHMQKLQETYGAKGVVWFSVASSAMGREGYLTAKENDDTRAKVKSKSVTNLLDPEGTVGNLYKAKTTPHMFIIDPKGVLIYNGALDDKPTPYSEDIPKSKNYVSAALDEALAGKAVTTATTRPYGCSVKYK